MLTIILFILLILALDIAAMRWGFDSRDGIEKVERKYIGRNISAGRE